MTENQVAIGDLCECCLASSSAHEKLFDMKKYQFEISPNKSITYFESYRQYIDQEFIITNAQAGIRQKICESCAAQLQNCVMFRQKCIMSQSILKKKRNTQPRNQTKRIALKDCTSASNSYPLTFQYSSDMSTTLRSGSANEAEEWPTHSITFDYNNPHESSTVVSDHCTPATTENEEISAAVATALPPDGMDIDETDDEERERRSATQQIKSQKKRKKPQTLKLFSSEEDEFGLIDEFRSWY